MAKRPPTPHDLTIRDQLAEASTVLAAHGRTDLAEAVDYVMSPAGFATVERLNGRAYLASMHEENANLPVGMERQVREHLKTAAKTAGGSLTRQAEAGLEAFLAGEFRPGKPPRVASGTGDRVVLNVRPAGALVDRAKALCLEPDLVEELGWRPTVSTLVRLWLLEQYPLPEPESADRA